jgi:hypothetical protein
MELPTSTPIPADLPRGTKVVVTLKDEDKEFAQVHRVESIIKRYSNFVPFPIELNGKTINTVRAIWTRNKNEIKDDEYNEFYHYTGHDPENPLFRLHFSADAPLAIQALLFVPSRNFETLGMNRTESEVNLYCRKVLIEPRAKGLFPDWLRFLKGVVDSEDLPLNISRETMQDTSLMQKLNRVLTGRFIKSLEDQVEKELEPGRPPFDVQFDRRKRNRPQVVVLCEHGDPQPVEIKLAPAGTLTGRLVDADGQPINDVTLLDDLEKFDDDDQAAVWADDPNIRIQPSDIPVDENGRFHLSGLIPGWTYTAHASAHRKFDGETMNRIIGSAFQNIRLQPGDRVAILSESCVEWVLADQGGIFSGVITVPIYPTLSPDQVKYIVNDCAARAIFFVLGCAAEVSSRACQ